MRHIPIFTFINKLDREARSPYDLMEELENEFGIGTYPMNWPIGCGQDFKGVFDREKREILAFTEFHRGQDRIKAVECSLEELFVQRGAQRTGLPSYVFFLRIVWHAIDNVAAEQKRFAILIFQHDPLNRSRDAFSGLRIEAESDDIPCIYIRRDE